MTEFLTKNKALCFITGASRGYGKALSLSFAEILSKDSAIVLIARNLENLSILQREIKLKRGTDNDLRVVIIDADLTSLSSDKAKELIGLGIGPDDRESFEQVILINNVGTLGDISKRIDSKNNLQNLQSYFNLNVLSVSVLNSVFLQTFSNLVQTENKCLIVNISSLAAIQAFQGMAEYCSGKAARDLYFKVMASEFPNISVINYAPGPMETDMTNNIVENALPEVKKWFIEAKSQKTLVNCATSVSKLISLLQKQNFKSGDHVDYFDV